ncbi:MAG: hypothetical protein OEZ10_08695 [Gammaproteobacteria bacterium]|nr:hypothetical protein [Gammaproteobacteria bacterium]
MFGRHNGTAFQSAQTLKRHDGAGFVDVNYVGRHDGAGFKQAWPVVAVADTSANGYSLAAGTAYAEIGLLADGRIYRNAQGVITYPGNWIDPVTRASGTYSVYGAIRGGTHEVITGPINSWHALSASAVWRIATAGPGLTDITSIIDIQIRNNTTLEILDTAALTIRATFDPNTG